MSKQDLSWKARPLWLLCAILLCLGTCSAQPRAWPDWTVPTAQGDTFSSRQLEGKVGVISVWGSWCPSCRKQLPVLNALQNTYTPEQLQVLAFSLDKDEESHAEFVKKRHILVPSTFARRGNGLTVLRMLQEGAGTLEAVPTVLIYDKRGRLAHRLVGFFNAKQLQDLIAPLTVNK